MARGKHNWAFALAWTNVAVATALLILVAGNRIPLRQLLHILAYCLVYANVTALLGALTLGKFARNLETRKFPNWAVMTLGIAVIAPIGCLLAQTMLMLTGFVIPQHFWPEYMQTLKIAMPLAIVFGSGAMVHASLRGRIQRMEEQLHQKEIAEERARKLALEARLRSLESRVHPHFLFNTLNSISSLITLDPVRAERMVGQLAVLLRASLDSSSQPVIPLQQEMAMVKSYLDIEKVRFGERLRGSFVVPAELQNAHVPPMSVQALVENAVKHGITPQSSGGEVQVTAAGEKGCLRLQVRDTGPGFDMTAISAGHGLENLVERLETLYGDRAHLDVYSRDGYCVVEMVLPRE